jgi:ribonuclease P protein component
LAEETLLLPVALVAERNFQLNCLKINTITQRSTFVKARDDGFSVAPRGFILQVLPNNLDIPRFGFTATKKLGNAVVRNRTKRRLRVLVQEFIKNGQFPSSRDYILIGRHTGLDRSFADLRGDLEYGLRKAGKFYAG